MELRISRVTLASVLESALETSRPLIEAGRHELTVDLPRETIWLDTDPVRLAQVFSNLLNNAATYTEKGGRIQVVAARRGSEVVASVKDNGIGIVPEMLPRVFDMFRQENPALERSQGGLGIGLSLAKGLVEAMGGRIEDGEWLSSWEPEVNIGLRAWALVTQVLLPLLKQEGGSIVNMASVGGLMGFAYTGAYAASKGGVISLSRTAAIECAQHNIRVNSISPDAVTDVFELLPDELKIQIARAYPLQRASSPDDIARAVLYLCSDDANSVTGHNLVIDGGYSGH